MKKKNYLLLVLTLIAAMIFSGCGGQSTSPVPTAESKSPALTEESTDPAPTEESTSPAPTEQSTDSATDTPQPAAESPVVAETAKMEVLYSENFSIEYLENGVQILTDGAGRKTLLVPDGVEKPSGYDDLQMVTTPVKRMLLSSSTHPSLLRPLGDDVFTSVAAVTTYDKGEGHIDQIDQQMEAGNTVYVGKTSALDYEKIQAAGIDVAFITRNLDTIAPKLEELGIPYIVENSSLETDVLGRMEWTKLFAAFLGKEAEATTHIENAAARIASVQEKVSGLEQPTVVAGFFREGEYIVRAGGSYNAKLHAIAGGDYLFKDYLPEETGTTKITPESFYATGVDADFFMYEPMGDPVESITQIVEQASVLADMKAIKEGNVWTYQPWWYRSVDKLDEIIEDYAAIYHPEAFPDHEITYFFKVPAVAE